MLKTTNLQQIKRKGVLDLERISDTFDSCRDQHELRALVHDCDSMFEFILVRIIIYSEEEWLVIMKIQPNAK